MSEAYTVKALEWEKIHDDLYRAVAIDGPVFVERVAGDWRWARAVDFPRLHRCVTKDAAFRAAEAWNLAKIEKGLVKVEAPAADAGAVGRLVELEAIVAKLPRTKDGVVVVPSVDRVWFRKGNDIASVSVACYGLCSSWTFDDGSTQERQIRVDECYSTGALALAAAGETKGEKP